LGAVARHGHPDEGAPPAEDGRVPARPAACPARRESSLVTALRVGAVEVRRCVGCGLGRTVPTPAEADERERFVGDPAYFRDAMAQPKDQWWHRFNRAPLALLEAAGAPPGLRLLDVGCNVGYLVAAARERGFRAHGLDGSAAAVAAGRAALGVEDRKSTRLNSSHVAISYAVFC